MGRSGWVRDIAVNQSQLQLKDVSLLCCWAWCKKKQYAECAHGEWNSKLCNRLWLIKTKPGFSSAMQNMFLWQIRFNCLKLPKLTKIYKLDIQAHISLFTVNCYLNFRSKICQFSSRFSVMFAGVASCTHNCYTSKITKRKQRTEHLELMAWQAYIILYYEIMCQSSRLFRSNENTNWPTDNVVSLAEQWR